MRLTITSWLIRGLPRQFWLMKEQTMFDLVPFAGARGKMADFDIQSGFISSSVTPVSKASHGIRYFRLSPP